MSSFAYLKTKPFSSYWQLHQRLPTPLHSKQKGADVHLLSSVNYNQDGINVERVKVNKRNLEAETGSYPPTSGPILLVGPSIKNICKLQ